MKRTSFAAIATVGLLLVGASASFGQIASNQGLGGLNSGFSQGIGGFGGGTGGSGVQGGNRLQGFVNQGVLQFEGVDRQAGGFSLIAAQNSNGVFGSVASNTGLGLSSSGGLGGGLGGGIGGGVGGLNTGLGGIGGGLGGFGGGFGNTGFGGVNTFGNSQFGFGGNQQQQQLGAAGGEATNQAQVRTTLSVGFPYRRQTSAASLQFAQNLTRIPQLKMRGPIKVEVVGRTAVLRGRVETEYDRGLAERLALLEPGISAVENKLEVASDATSSDAGTTSDGSQP